MQDKHISVLFDKIKSRIFAREAKKQHAQDIILKKTGLLFPLDAINFNNQTLVVEGKPIFKNELMLKKQVLLDAFKEDVVLSKINTIR